MTPCLETLTRKGRSAPRRQTPALILLKAAEGVPGPGYCASARDIGAIGGEVTIQLPGGGLVKARGSAEVGQNVFVRDGVLEAVAPAPGLAVVLIEI